jgi:RNA polymerase sigma-70 factor (ECF subfamily)
MTLEEKQAEFLKLYEPVNGPLSRFARTLARNTEDARDLIAETLLIAYENFEKLKDKGAFKSYNFSIAYRLQRKKKMRNRWFAVYEEESAEKIPSHETPAETKLDIEILYRAIRSLPEKQRVAITLFEISGFSIEEIRQLQGRTISGVKSRLRRARETLAAIFREEESPKRQNSILPGNGYLKNNTEIIEKSNINNISLRIINE